MTTLCYSVRLEALVSISDKCYKAVAFDGSEALIPKSQVLGVDRDVSKSDAYWISAWILEKKELQYSEKKSAWLDEDGNIQPVITTTHHHPEVIAPIDDNFIPELAK